MSSPDLSAVRHVVENGPYKQEEGRKQLTLAFGGLYVASTTLTAKPSLIWESENGYARYYIPTESLHKDVRACLARLEVGDKDIGDEIDQSPTPIFLILSQSMRSGDGKRRAQIEKLTVGEKCTTWARFVEGPLKGLIRFERSEIDDWFENGKLFISIKNPYKRIDTAAVSNHIVIKIDGEEVAETNAAVLLNETGLKETYYLPATSIKDWGSVEKSSLRTACPYKGEAWYLSITVEGKKHENLIWYYPYPTHESAGVEGLISFYNKENVEILVDDERI